MRFLLGLALMFAGGFGVVHLFTAYPVDVHGVHAPWPLALLFGGMFAVGFELTAKKKG